MGKRGHRTLEKKTRTQLKHTLDEVFSRYIRAVHPPVCITCGATGTKMDAGHWISRKSMATRWDERNVRPQCATCNRFGAGRVYDFEQALILEIGKNATEEMKARRHEVVRHTEEWMIEQIKYYRRELKEMGNVD